MQNHTQWILCPVCGNKTRDRIREDTVLKNYPLYCPKCKRETLIEAKDFLHGFCCLPCSCNCLSLFRTLSLSGGVPAEKEVLYSDKYISLVSARKGKNKGKYIRLEHKTIETP